MLYDNNSSFDHFNSRETAKAIAGQMRKLRISRNLTQQNLAARSGVSFGSIKRFETQFEISLGNLLRIALVLDALGPFRELFPTQEYQSMDQLLRAREVKNRKRARHG